MSGIYIHIPFCKKACHYCDFHFSTTPDYQDRMIDAICKEIDLKSEKFKNIETLYFGGGTPSILSERHFDQLFDRLARYIDFNTLLECTLEANPDDIHKDFLRYLKQTPIDRFSLGIQSFHDEDLLFMNRAHSSKEAETSIQQIMEAGFDKVSLDLIYGLPNSTDASWMENIQKALSFDIDHISAYCLTIEEKTVLANWQKKGKFKALPDEQAIEQFKVLIEHLEQAGYEHYEISNFAQEGKRAIHNANYWKGKPYYGLGHSAHSYIAEGYERTWNIANNTQYMNRIEAGELAEEKEKLTLQDRFNEYLMIRLRTKEGIDLSELKKHYGTMYVAHFHKVVTEEGLSNYFIQNGELWSLNFDGKIISDQIISDLFYVE